MNRRDFLGIVAAAPLVQVLDAPRSARPRLAAIGVDGQPLDGVEVTSDTSGPFVRPRVVNRRDVAVSVKEVVVLDEAVQVPASTAIYGEGFQMLTQTAGTIASPTDLSQYTDAKHYRIPASGGDRTYYGLLTLSPSPEDTRLFAFTSCARFSGRFTVSALPSAQRGRSSARYRITAIVDTEGLPLGPGDRWPLEELLVASGRDRSRLLGGLAERLAFHHPPLRTATPPTGWCSWYCFGPRVTAQQVLDNLDTIAKNLPALTYVQIDDGYQSAMGDWLDTGAAFGGNVRTVLAEIRRRGFQPAIWVAPFVAEASSSIFKQHPDWFIADAAGEPLRSDRVTFGGWRRGPWYAIDGTHPAAQAHLEQIFRTMRTEWGCTYFKLDANFWGAMHGGRFHDPRATRIAAYRRGMAAIRRGAGDAFLLGCNHPIWPSIGEVHGSRSSNDIKRAWDRVASTARQNLSRNWQNGRLWWNDPDAVVLAGELTDAEWHDPLRRRPDRDAASARGDAAEALAADRRRSGVRRRERAGRNDSAARRAYDLSLQLGGSGRHARRSARAAGDRRRLLVGRGARTPRGELVVRDAAALGAAPETDVRHDRRRSSPRRRSARSSRSSASRSTACRCTTTSWSATSAGRERW
jgi:alpha-galactosidase